MRMQLYTLIPNANFVSLNVICENISTFIHSQFTENGVFVFTEENEEKYGYPYPTEGGFSSSVNDQLVVPFWSDIDLSTTTGDVYYQVRMCTMPTRLYCNSRCLTTILRE